MERPVHGEVVLALDAGAKPTVDEIAEWLWGDPCAEITRDSFVALRARVRDALPAARLEVTRMRATRSRDVR